MSRTGRPAGTSYKDGVNAVDRLVREAAELQSKMGPAALENSRWPGNPLLRPSEYTEYLRRLKDWVERVKGEWTKP